MINRKRFFALMSGGAIGSVAPKALEAEEEFVQEEFEASSFVFNQQRLSSKPQTDSIIFYPNLEPTDTTVKMTWSQDGSLWLIHSNGAKKKLVG